MPKLHQIIEHHWQQPNLLLACVLWPFSRLFGVVARLRRQRFLFGMRKTQGLNVPVVVVGNIHAGGTGKTPIVASLVKGLQARGIQVGIISRGYGRESSEVCVLTPKSTAAQVGDEPLLLYRQTGAPMAVGSKRVEAGQALLRMYPDVEMIVTDDGLQHYALQRDLEIAVFPFVDYARQRRLDVLPNGPLREPLSRLCEVDAIVMSACPEEVRACQMPSENIFLSRVAAGRVYRLFHEDEYLHPDDVVGKRVVAVAGIAKPERFFTSLRVQGFDLADTIVLPDHASFSKADLPEADVVLITEKDAIKLTDHLLENVWVLPVCAIIEPDLADWVCQQVLPRYS